MKQKAILKLLALAAIAPVFGYVYWTFLELLQPGIANQIYGCGFCSRCANILYDREQIVLAFCAGLAFVAAGFQKTGGSRGVLKTAAATYLSFQIYSLATVWSTLKAEECTALHRIRVFPIAALILLLIEMLIISGFWAAICAAPLVLCNLIRSLVFRDDEQFPKLGLK